MDMFPAWARLFASLIVVLGVASHFSFRRGVRRANSTSHTTWYARTHAGACAGRVAAAPRAPDARPRASHDGTAAALLTVMGILVGAADDERADGSDGRGRREQRPYPGKAIHSVPHGRAAHGHPLRPRRVAMEHPTLLETSPVGREPSRKLRRNFLAVAAQPACRQHRPRRRLHCGQGGALRACSCATSAGTCCSASARTAPTWAASSTRMASR